MMNNAVLESKSSLQRKRSYAIKKLPSLTRSISIHSEKQLPLLFDVNDIEIIEEIGQGAFGKIHKVHHKNFQEDLVIKGVLNNAGECEAYLLKEVSLLQRLKHPNLLCSFGVLVMDHQLWLVTEFVCAGSLHDYVLVRPHRFLSWQTRISFAADIASAMNGSVVVADLGLALLTRPPEATHEARDAHGFSRNPTLNCRIGARCFFSGSPIKEISSDEDAQPEYEIHPSLSAPCQRRNKRKYQVLGSPFWMAPEMFSSKPYDESVDIYSFGVILCQLIGRVDADPDVLERRSSTLSIDTDKFLKTHVPEDAPRELVELAIACTRLESDSRPSFSVCHSWLQGNCLQRVGMEEPVK
uniref:LIM domain kinase 1 n=1 Tax=Schistocephalus solidus TaxID=70667 RepID=A0A0V0JAH6_SCHSO